MDQLRVDHNIFSTKPYLYKKKLAFSLNLRSNVFQPSRRPFQLIFNGENCIQTDKCFLV